MDKLYSVEDLAATCDTTSRAVRLYMEKGLLKPMRAGRTYVFTEVDMERLNVILRCKRIGLSLDDIQKRLNPSDKQEIQDMIERITHIRVDAEAELKALCVELSHTQRQKRS